jgi:uncharacterized protein (UPF0332 family)
MSRENTLALVRYRLEQADDAVRAAHLLLDQYLPRDAVNRAYYGMFYAVLALLVTKQLGTSYFSSSILEVSGETLEIVSGPIRVVCNSDLHVRDIETARTANRG